MRLSEHHFDQLKTRIFSARAESFKVSEALLASTPQICGDIVAFSSNSWPVVIVPRQKTLSLASPQPPPSTTLPPPPSLQRLTFSHERFLSTPTPTSPPKQLPPASLLFTRLG